jgi:hypothetical protein
MRRGLGGRVALPVLPILRFLFALTSALLLVIIAHLVGLWHAGGVGQPRVQQRDWLIFAGIALTTWALLGQAIASRLVSQQDPQRK